MRYFISIIFLSSNLVFAECNKVNTSRFIINNDKVFDKETKLTWLRCSLGSIWKDQLGCAGTPEVMYFDEAIDLIQKQNNKWRIPTILELNSITKNNCKNIAINSTIFPDIQQKMQNALYWSSTHVKNMPTLIYYIDFINNTVDAHSKGFSMFVRLVSDQNE